MESNRAGNRLNRLLYKPRQAGITLIGFLILAAFFGVVGLAVLKIVPLYMEKMRVGTVLEDLQTEFSTGSNSAQRIRIAINERFYVENLEALSSDELSIEPRGAGYTVTVNRESRAPFFADLYFVVAINEQIEIAR